MNCPNCGAITMRGIEYCPECGAGIDSDLSAPVKAPPKPGARFRERPEAKPAPSIDRTPHDPSHTFERPRQPEPTLHGDAVYASFGRRFTAHLLDVAIASILYLFVAGAVAVIIAVVRSVAGTETAPEAGDAYAWAYWLFCLLYDAGLTSSPLQATLGKLFMGLRVTDMRQQTIPFKRALLRHLVEWVSYAMMGLGHWVQPMTQKRQALHDIAVGTIVSNR